MELDTNRSQRTLSSVQSATHGLVAELTTGSPAPLFSLPDADMEMFDLREALSRHNVVLYFYPRDGMPSSTQQSILYSDHESEFTDCDAEVVGVSLDDCLRHADFRDEHGLSMRLLSDEDAEACRLYGVWHQQEIGGVPKASVQRKTFIIRRDGVIHRVFQDVGSREHLAAVLQSLKELTRSEHGNRQEHRRNA
ncbi:MAG: peroxiredoxin [Rhodocyclaceae bacterium]